MIDHFEPSALEGGPPKPVLHDASDGFIPIASCVQTNRSLGSKSFSFKPKDESRVSRSPAKFSCLSLQRHVFVTVCAWCDKGIQQGDDRDRSDSWRPVELARFKNTGARVTHGICPKCMRTVCNEAELVIP